MQKSTTKIKKKAGKLKLKEWIRDRSIGSSIKQNFENPFPVIYLFCKTCKHTSVLICRTGRTILGSQLLENM